MDPIRGGQHAEHVSVGKTVGLVPAGPLTVPVAAEALRGPDPHRSVRPDDVQVVDDELAVGGQSLLTALEQLAKHMKVTHGMDVQVEARGGHRVEEPGQRVLLFDAIQDLLLFMARPAKCEAAHIRLYEQDGYNVVELEPEGKTIDFGAPTKVTKAAVAEYDVLEHLCERLYQVAGRLRIDPDRRNATRIVLTAAIET